MNFEFYITPITYNFKSKLFLLPPLKLGFQMPFGISKYITMTKYK